MVTSIEDGVVRYQIQQVRTGSLGGYAVDNFVDVYYRDDAAFLKKSIRYLVGANPDPLTNQLSSKVREATPLFGGADIAGLDSAGNACPQYEDPVRTLNVDGSSVESGTLKPLMDAKGRIVGSIAVAVVVVFAGLFGLVIVKRSIYRASRATTKRRRQQMHSRVSR